MKTNHIARRILKIRRITVALVIVGLAAVEVGFGGSLAARLGQYSAPQTQSPQAPNMSFGDFMAAASVIR